MFKLASRICKVTTGESLNNDYVLYEIYEGVEAFLVACKNTLFWTDYINMNFGQLDKQIHLAGKLQAWYVNNAQALYPGYI